MKYIASFFKALNPIAPDLKLLKHGEYISPLCIELSQQLAKKGERLTVYLFKNEEGKKGLLTIKALPKNKRASEKRLAFGWIRTCYPHAIEYTSPTTELKGFGLFYCILGLAMFGGGGLFGFLLHGLKHHNIVGIVMGLCSIAVGIGFFMFGLRATLYSPVDEPMIFDRQHRKLYRLFKERQLGLFGLFKPWPLRCVAYDWDLIDVHHITQVTVARAGASADNGIGFSVMRDRVNNELIDMVDFGYTLVMNSSTVPPIWEHARRFMEAEGSHLPPGEGMAAPYDMRRLGFSAHLRKHVLGKNNTIVEGVKNHPYWSALIMLTAPISLPLLLGTGITDWLVHITQQPIQWPQEVLEAVGKPLSKEEVLQISDAD